MEYSECRQASFTFKKAKKFRDWIMFAKYVDIKPNDDIVEILGYLAWEIVRIITDTALKVKHKYERFQSTPLQPEKTVSLGDIFGATEWNFNGDVDRSNLSKVNSNSNLIKKSDSSINLPESIFEKPDKRTFIKTEHIYEACRLLERSSYVFSPFTGGLMKKRFSPIA